MEPRKIKPPPIPERISSRIPRALQIRITETQQRQASHVSHMSSISIASSTVSDFLEEKIKSCDYDYAASMAQVMALQNVRENNVIDKKQYDTEIGPFLAHQAKLVEELGLLKKHRKILTEDMEEEVENAGKKSRKDEPAIDFYERAYAETILPRVIGASAKQRKQSFKPSIFKQNVLEAYNAFSSEGGLKTAWCHLSREWIDSDDVKAAHLMPKSLSRREVGYLFGVEEVPDNFFYDWRLGISLHKKFEEGLDRGIIVIVPIPSQTFTWWECRLVDESQRSLVAGRGIPGFSSTSVKWGDLNRRELRFLGDKRPAKRYLYFRFIVTVMHAQRTGNTEFLKRLENREIFWASPGSYLRKSTLVSLARNISGLELPPAACENTTFEGETEAQSSQDTASVLAFQLREATIESYRSDEGENY